MNSAASSPLVDPDAMQSWFGGRIPIVIGTVGHRDLDTANRAIVKAVRKECRLLRRKYRDSPFLILSGLAEGADRLIARIALEELDAILIAVLPFPAADFCADFKTDTSREEFSSLLNRASATFEVPIPSDGLWREAGEKRDMQYARVGALIAEQSQILLALWDGRPARGIGGTGEVVVWFERGYAEREYSIYEGDLSLFDLPQPGLCIRIEPATGETEIRNAIPTRRRFGLFGKATIRDILKRTNVYNRDVRRQPAYHVERTLVLPEDALAKVPIAEAYAAFTEADALAIYFARRVRLADWVFYALALAAVFAFSSVDTKPLASWGFLSVMAVMAGVAFYVWSCALDAKFLEYRSFAEAMRILSFWRLLGLRRQVWLSYLSKHGAVVRWLRHAVRAVEFAQDRRLPLAGKAISDEKLLDVAIDHWLGLQIDYFKRSVMKHSRRYWRGLWFTRAAVALTFATSILLAAMTLTYGEGLHAWRPHTFVPHPFGPMPIEDFIRQLQVAVGLMAALGIAARGFLLRRADLELSKQYASAQEKFEMAERQIQTVPKGDPHGQLPPIFENLGREALLEEAEWLWLRHSRPFEAPN